MSAPTGEASTAAAPAVPASQPQTAPATAASQSASAQLSTVSQRPDVSGGNPTQTQHTVPVAQGTAQGQQGQRGQQGQAPPTGAPTGPGASVPRAPAAITRDTYAVRSLGPAVNSLVKKVCETPSSIFDRKLRGPQIASPPSQTVPLEPSLRAYSLVLFLKQPRLLWTRTCPSATSTSLCTRQLRMRPLLYLSILMRVASRTSY